MNLPTCEAIFHSTPAESGFVVSPDQPLKLGATQPVLGHSINPDGTMWLSGGIDFEGQPSDRAPFVVFDLGADVAVSGVKIWNYNENHVRDLTGRGAKEIRITGATAADGRVPNGVWRFHPGPRQRHSPARPRHCA